MLGMPGDLRVDWEATPGSTDLCKVLAQSMLQVNEGTDGALFLCVGDGREGQRCLACALRAKDLRAATVQSVTWQLYILSCTAETTGCRAWRRASQGIAAAGCIVINSADLPQQGQTLESHLQGQGPA